MTQTKQTSELIPTKVDISNAYMKTLNMLINYYKNEGKRELYIQTILNYIDRAKFVLVKVELDKIDKKIYLDKFNILYDIVYSLINHQDDISSD